MIDKNLNQFPMELKRWKSDRNDTRFAIYENLIGIIFQDYRLYLTKTFLFVL